MYELILMQEVEGSFGKASQNRAAEWVFKNKNENANN